MHIINTILVSDEVIDSFFCCDLQTCKGACCLDGDAGAPLENYEIKLLEKYFSIFKKYMTKEGVKIIEKRGVFDYDSDNELVTPLLKNEDCAYICYEGDIAKCAIEKAYVNGEIDFYKPISCHLYPIRIMKLPDYEVLNLHRWQVCKNAYVNGEEKKIKVIDFLKEALIRKYGEEWYFSLKNEFPKE